VPELINSIIRSVSKDTVKDCLEAIRLLNTTEREVLQRVFEFSGDSRFSEPLAFALNYLTK